MRNILALSKFFIDQRGKKPNYFQKEWEGSRDRRTFKTGAPVPPPDLKYNQSHEPVLQQEAPWDMLLGRYICIRRWRIWRGRPAIRSY